MEREYQEKLSLLSELIKLARVDEEVKAIEYQFLEAIALQLDVKQDDFAALFERYIRFTPPRLEGERILQFQRLVLLMHIDLEVHPAQLQLIRELGIRMGLAPAATNEVLRFMDQYPNKVVPAEQLIQLFQVHHN